MEHEVRGYGFDGRLGSLVLERMAFRSKLEKDAAYLYIPVDDNENVQQAQYDVLDALNADLVTLKPQKPDRLHITLLFIEKVKDDDLEDFFNRLNLILPVAFELEVVRSGTFPESDEKPLVLHLAPSPSLLRLQQELYDTAFSMGLPISVHSKPKYYNPHITLAYNYMPQDIKIPDLAAPFKIPIYNFVCTRQEYEVVRTIHLPNFHNEEVMVTRLLGGEPSAATGQAQVSEADSTSTTGARGKDIEDDRIEQMLGDDLPEEKLPETVRIVYTPDLKIESRQTRSRDFVDIELGPPFWDIGDRGVRAGALAFQFGNIVADEMILGLGGAHEWSRADALLQAPPKEQEAGFRFVFGTNSIVWAASYCYASYIINGPQEMQTRGYEDALRWIEIALEQYPDYDAENAPDFHSLIDELGDFPPEGVAPDYLIGKGGKGSGHHGHKGRPGEVGGSQPSGGTRLDLGKGYIAVPMGKNRGTRGTRGTERIKAHRERLIENNEWRFDVGELQYWLDTHPDLYGTLEEERAIAAKELQDAIADAMLDFAAGTFHDPTGIIFTDDADPILEEYYSDYDLTEEQLKQKRKEILHLLYGNTKASFIGNEEFPEGKKIIHLNVERVPDEYTLELTYDSEQSFGKIAPSDERIFAGTIHHELGHWLSLEANVRNMYSDEENPTLNDFAPSDEWKYDNRFYDPSQWAHEYQADLIASLMTEHMGFRSHDRALTDDELSDRDRLMDLIDERMAEKAALVERSELPKPILALIPWGDGTYEGVLISSNDLPPDQRENFPLAVIYRGGPGSGHHEHRGRKGEVGGSLPSGAAGEATAESGISIPREYKSPEYGERIDRAIENFEAVVGGLPSKVAFISDDIDTVIEKIIELESTEERPYTDEEREKLTERLRSKLARTVGANIPVNWGEHIAIYMNEKKSTGSQTFDSKHGGEWTLTADPEEVEYVLFHELGHAVMKEPFMEGKLQGAYLDYLNELDTEKYPDRMEQTMVPHSYVVGISNLYKDMSAIESEYYADMIGYAVRLASNPNDTRVSLGGDREIDIEFDWSETDEPPREVANLFLGVVKDYYSEQQEGEDV